MTEPARTLHRWTRAEYDRADKAAAYARNAIPEYWVLNLRDRRLEVHRRPQGDAYGERTHIDADGRIAPLAAPAAPVPVAALLP